MRIAKSLIEALRQQNEASLEKTTNEESKAYLQGKIDAYTILLGDRLSEHPKNRKEIWT